MSFYNNNLNLFKDKLPIVYSTIVNEKDIYNVQFEEIEESINYFVIKENRKCLIHSLYSIEEEMYQMFKNINKNVETLMVFGIGCGYALRYINENFKKIKNLLIIEPSITMFKNFMSNLDIYDEIKNFDNVSFVVNKNLNEANLALFQYIKDKIDSNIGFVYNVSYRTIFDGYYESINEMLTTYISKYTLNLNANYYFRQQWTYNPIKNLTQSAILIDDLFDKFKGKSAILVSAGPSLNKNIHLLEQVKDKALIVSVGTASKILESKNIVPHFRFAMDSQQAEKVIFENLKEDDSTLVFSDRVYNEILPIFKKRLRMVLDLDVLTQHVYSKMNVNFKTIRSGFSIANTALDALTKLGVKNIIFLGQDMCYTRDKLYADGSWLENNKLNLNDEKFKYIEVKDINGEDVYTISSFLGIKNIFEEIIEANPNINYINATEGGIGIKGTTIKSFKDVIKEDLIEDYDFNTYIKQFFKMNKENDYSKEAYETVVNLEHYVDEMININEERIKRIKKIDRYLEKGMGLNKINEELTYINKYEDELMEIDFYNSCVKEMMDATYKAFIFKHKYNGDEFEQAIRSRKKIIELVSEELKGYLFFVKACVKDVKDSSKAK